MTAVDPALLQRRRAVVIGGSAGAIQVLRQVLPMLFVDVPIVVALHLAPHWASGLPTVFARECKMPVEEPYDKQSVAAGTIYFAPADYHLLIERGGTFALSVGPRVNHSRPSIDVLLESACHAYRGRLVVVLLSGANEDGVEGAEAIQERGGLVIVQAPETAEFATLPRAAIQKTNPQLILPPRAIFRVLSSLSREVL